jgi:hypothetical protein
MIRRARIVLVLQLAAVGACTGQVGPSKGSPPGGGTAAGTSGGDAAGGDPTGGSNAAGVGGGATGGSIIVDGRGGAAAGTGAGGSGAGGAAGTSTAGRGGTTTGTAGRGGAAGTSAAGRGGTTATGTAGRGGTTGTGTAGRGGAAGSSTGGMTPMGGAAGHYVTTNYDLCAGRVSDLMAHPMTALAKPALGAAVIDAEFGTTIRRISAVSGTGANAAIIPMYTTISAWNADESRLILYAVGHGHQLYDGKTYQLIKSLDISPPDLEQVYWDTSNPDLFYYVDGQTFIRYHVSTGTKDKLHDFTSLCGSSEPTGGDDPFFTSWDSHRLGLACGTKMFIYDWSNDSVLGPVAAGANASQPAQVAPSGNLAFLEAGTGQVVDTTLSVVRSLGFQDPFNHASLGQLANGHDTWNGTVFDDGNDDAKSNVGVLATWDLTTGTGGALIGPKTGYPYPPTAHVSALAYRQPGWVYVSTFFVNGFEGTGTPPTPGLLDLENLIADTNTGKVCRVGRHRSWGKSNQVLGYWAEAHTVPSPTGTRAVFGSDWGGGSSVDAYVLELPAYTP